MDHTLDAGSRAGLPIDREWPHIGWALRVHPERNGSCQYELWSGSADKLSSAERAAGYEEWATYVEYDLAHRANELTVDPIRRHLVETWTDTMSYSFRRLAAYARGEDPGEAIPQYKRRPDLVTARLAHLNDSDAAMVRGMTFRASQISQTQTS